MLIYFVFLCLHPILSAIVEQYLLEKSRIVSQAPNERNYHVFYYLLQGAEDKERENLWLEQSKDYFYLNQVKNTENYSRSFPFKPVSYNSILSTVD